MAPPSDREEPLLGCSLEEFVAGPSIPPLQRFTDELAEFCGACRAAAAGAVAAAGPSGAASALRRQAARDADILLLAEWWNELLGDRDALVALLFGARAELRESSPSRSVLRAQVHQAAQQYLRIAKDATAAAHAELLATQRHTDGPRIDILEQVLSAVASNVSYTTRPLTWFSGFERDAWRVRPADTVFRSPVYTDDEQVYEQPDAVDGGCEGAVMVSVPGPAPEQEQEQQRQQQNVAESTAQRAAAEQHDEAVEHSEPSSRRCIPAADMDSLPTHTTLDPQQRLVRTVTAAVGGLQACPPMSAMKAAPRVVDEVGALQPSVRGEPLAYLEELAVPPAWHRSHTDRQALRQVQDEYWDGGDDYTPQDAAEERHDFAAGDNDDGGSGGSDGWQSLEGGRLIVPAWARATLLDC
jgi:hypothetical protein